MTETAIVGISFPFPSQPWLRLGPLVRVLSAFLPNSRFPYGISTLFNAVDGIMRQKLPHEWRLTTREKSSRRLRWKESDCVLAVTRVWLELATQTIFFFTC